MQKSARKLLTVFILAYLVVSMSACNNTSAEPSDNAIQKMAILEENENDEQNSEEELLISVEENLDHTDNDDENLISSDEPSDDVDILVAVNDLDEEGIDSCSESNQDNEQSQGTQTENRFDTEQTEQTDDESATALSSAYTYMDMDKTVYTTVSLNIRSGPFVDFEKIGAYDYNASVIVTGQCNETGWYRVNYNNTVGYCDSNYTTDTKQKTSETNTSNATENTTSESTNNSVNTETYSLSNIVIAGDSGVSAYYVNLCQQAYAQVPQWVRNLFEGCGWTVKVRSGSFWTAYGYNVSLLGLTVYDERTIYIGARDMACNYNTVGHELGHFIDWYYGFPSHGSEFNGIYNTEYRSFCNYFNYSNGYPGVEELFAEALYHYWTDSGNLVYIAPQTYGFIQRLLQ